MGRDNSRDALSSEEVSEGCGVGLVSRVIMCQKRRSMIGAGAADWAVGVETMGFCLSLGLLWRDVLCDVELDDA